MREQAFDRTDAVKAPAFTRRSWCPARELVMLFRASMSRELEEIGCLEGRAASGRCGPATCASPLESACAPGSIGSCTPQLFQ